MPHSVKKNMALILKRQIWQTLKMMSCCKRILKKSIWQVDTSVCEKLLEEITPIIIFIFDSERERSIPK